MRWLLILLVAALAGGAGYYYWQQQPSTKLDIETVAASRGDVRRLVSTSGTVSALGKVEIRSQLSGIVGELMADLSSEVKEGQALARIEPSPFEMRVREEEASASAAKANLALQQASVARAEANLRKIKADFANSDSPQEEAAAVAQQTADAEVALAKANVENAKAALAQREAALDSARLDLEHTYIRSPINGVVIERATEEGQRVAANGKVPKLFTVAQSLSRVQIEAQVEEAYVGQVVRGNPVSFTVPAYPSVAFKGQVERIHAVPKRIKEGTTYTVVVVADNPLGQLLPGMTANLEIVTAEANAVLVVPNEALNYQPHGSAQAALVRDNWAAGVNAISVTDQRERFVARLKEELELNDTEASNIDATLAREFADLDPGSRPRNPEGLQEYLGQIRARIYRVLRASLSPEQYKRYEALERQRPTGPRSVTLWTYEGGVLVPHEVRLGLADTNSTEIKEGLGEGDPIVLGVREIRP
ncbi:MAG: efflux RND transporter periplasmic adaptor subunit [Methyloceanibacter sp.]